MHHYDTPRGSRIQAGLALAFLVAGAATALPARAQAPGAETPPPAVVVEEVQVEEIDHPEEFIAQTEAVESVDIRARVQGFLDAVRFDAGQAVEEGDLLFEIEPAQYEAEVASAQAQQTRAEAALRQAQETLERTKELAERQTASRASLDDAQASADIAAADLESAKAALRTAELNLSYTKVHAPIAGQIGRALITRGNLVNPESGALARIVQIDPIRVVFSLSEDLFTALRQQIIDAGGSFEASALRMTLRLPNGSDYPHEGRLDFIANEIDSGTGTVPVRLIFPNPDGLLVPGQYVSLFIAPDQGRKLPVVPQSAVLQDRSGRFVYLLQDDNSVALQRIETSARVEDGWAVSDGLEGGEEVVTSGTQRLRDGISVNPSRRGAAGDGS